MQSFTCTFKGAQIQFDWLDVSIVYDKSFQHTTIYNSYDLELVSKSIKTIKFENTSTTYSLTGKSPYDLEKASEGCSTAPLTQCKNNEIIKK